MNEVQHLHLYTGTYNKEPTYHELIERGLWGGLNLDGMVKPPWSATHELMSCGVVSLMIRNSMRVDRISPFPSLRTVSLGGYQDHIWGSPQAEEWEKRALDGTGIPIFKDLPISLLEIPSVEHFCQSNEFGPLALMPNFIAPSGMSTLKVFTCHLQHPGRQAGLKSMFAPVIMGSTKRYYYVYDPIVDKDDPPRASTYLQGQSIAGEEMLITLSLPFRKVGSEVVGSIKGMNIQLPSDHEFSKLSNESKAAQFPSDRNPIDESTIVEIYGLCPSDLGPIPGMTVHDPAYRRIPPIEELQDMLDEQLPEIWRGKVFLKSKADAPPCTACGRLLGE